MRRAVHGSVLFSLVLFLFSACAPVAKSSISNQTISTDSADFVSDSRCVGIGGDFVPRPKCGTQMFELTPGHHDFLLRYRGTVGESDLANSLSIKIELFNEQREPIEVLVPYLSRTLEGSELNGTFIAPTQGQYIRSDRYAEMTLIHRPYPADSGWIPEAARMGRIVVTYQGLGEFRIAELQVKRSKWNHPFSKRNQCIDVPRVKLSSKPDIAVLSQGPLKDQLALLKSGTARKIADVYLLELGPDSFLGSEMAPETVALVSHLRDSASRWGIAYHPYWFMDPQRAPSPFRISNPLHLKIIADRIAWFVNQGASTVILRADDLVPQNGDSAFSYELTDSKDIAQFNSLAAAHLDLITKIFNPLPQQIKRYFVPPWYNSYFIRNNMERARVYFQTLTSQVAPEIGLIWSGPSLRSLTVDSLELESFRSFSNSLGLSLWDNTVYARRHKDFWKAGSERARFNSFFEPYSVSLPSPYLYEGRIGEDLVIINGELSPFSQVQMENAKNYFSAKERFCPERDMRQIVKSRWGTKRARRLFELDSIFWEECLGDSKLSNRCSEIDRELRETSELLKQE
jgi:hypothetical protein